MEKLKLSVTLPASPKEIYEAWLNSKAHSTFTGGKATASAKVKGKFSAWDKYITGHNVELKPGKKIVQAWRTVEFPKTAPDSTLEVKLTAKAGGKTHLTLTQTDIPKGQGKKYKNGWKEHYFVPMKTYFVKKKK
jgi:activator of HSP90 ATPase